MQVIKLDANYQQQLSDGYVVAIGNFDGIHSAHAQILRMAKKIAKENNLKFGVMTFDTTPKKVVNQIENYYILRSQAQKEEILNELGVDTLFLFEFTKEFANLSAQDFIQRFIISNSVKYLVCGFDYHFGKDKSGDVELLMSYPDFKTIILSQEKVDNLKIGSTYIHELVLQGNVEKANRLLTKPYSIVGKVIHGSKKGRNIGYPTANILPIDNYRIPANGVYATKTIINGKAYESMSNIGHNPTFNYNNNIRIETNIFGFDGDLYGQMIEVVFYKYIRQEKVFDSIDDLIKQMAKDKQAIIEYFEQES